MATDAMCMWLMSSSTCRNEASCGLMRSNSEPPLLGMCEFRSFSPYPTVPTRAPGGPGRAATSRIARPGARHTPKLGPRNTAHEKPLRCAHLDHDRRQPVPESAYVLIQTEVGKAAQV